MLNKLNAIAPGAILQRQRFGQSPHLCVWVETKAILKIARGIRDDQELKLDWLENLSVTQLDTTLVVTYFIRSTQNSEVLYLRASKVANSVSEEVEIPSVRSVWPMAHPWECEAGELFGIKFIQEGVEKFSNPLGRRLPEGWRGFPLRKGYVFPKDIFGISHHR